MSSASTIVTSFTYTAVDRNGLRCRGVARAVTEVDAFRQISAAGLTPVKIRQTKARRGRRGVGLKDIAHFTYQLSVLIGARVKGTGQAKQKVDVKAGETATVDLKLEAPKAK